MGLKNIRTPLKKKLYMDPLLWLIVFIRKTYRFIKIWIYYCFWSTEKF